MAESGSFAGRSFAGRSFADRGEKYDVAILGSHLASGLLAAVLARNGVRVLLADGPADAAQPAGETTVPYTSEVFFTIARRFGIPEIAAFGLTCDLPEAVRRSSGVKRSLGFLYHVPGTEQNPRQAMQFNVPGEHSEWHVYRPAVDEYAREIALRYGARAIRYRPAVADVLPGKDDVSVVMADGGMYRARYIVDAIGPDSPFLREARPDPGGGPGHGSRVITTHLRGVRAFEDIADQQAYGPATPWSLGTMSHLFAGGWLQVAHFGNHADAGDQVSGVTLSLGPDGSGDLPADPAQAFRAVITRFPSLARCFDDAIAVRPWAERRSGQRTSALAAADRVFLFERTASRGDEFLSSDVTMSAELVHALAPVLTGAAMADDWSAERLGPAARFQAALTDFSDRMLAGARVATRDFTLWNAFARVWLLWSILGALTLKSTRNECLRTGDWSPVERLADGAFWFALPHGLPDLLEDTLAGLEEVGRDEVLPRVAASRIFAALDAADFVPPLYRFSDPDARYYHFTPARRARMLVWSKTVAPPEFRRMLTRENLTNVPPPAVH